MRKRTRNTRPVSLDRSLGAFAAVAQAVSQTLDLEQLLDIALAKVLDNCAPVTNGKEDPDPYEEPSSYSSCPACGKLTLRRSGGCSQCVGCGYSTC